MRLRFFLALLAALLAGCGGGAPEPEFFPLEAGQRWVYKSETRNSMGTRSAELTFRTLPAERVNGQKAAVRLSSGGNRYYLVADETGIARIAKQTAVELAPRLDPNPRPVLMYPLKVGTTWQSTTHPYVLTRIIPMGETVRRSITLPMQYSIAALDETVDVPAGRFGGCLKVVGRATFDLYADGRRGFIEIPFTTTEWYAPGVGLVKLERTEELETDVFTGGTVTLELLDYEG